ncbi:lysozyme inhibitor LprI family protein [Falsihalocynthiibacter sp. S25ZX9]|uniref:lysozyme inhibitor LprI family protein n=1 Tax=Falsihalocynthiibacter sp. S25ZX9 TaxID=3240870 RepID=UPI00350E929C
MNRLFSVIASLVTLFIAGGAQAQDIKFSPDLSLSCYYESDAMGQPHGCIGLSANQCMEVSSGGYSTRGMDACFGAEIELWDGLLNLSYQSLRESDQQADGASGGTRATALRDMQRAWIVFRDNTCKYEYAQWAGGSGAGPAYAACVMNMTGQQAMALDVMLSQNLAQ